MSLAIRPMEYADFAEVAELIFASTNAWYETNRGHPAFTCAPEDCRIYCEVYDELDPGQGLVAVEEGQIMGSCFYHPRETHASLGIMNVHPVAFGRGVGRQLLDAIVARATTAGLPLRLISSAMNLDSYSLYHRAGFTPVELFHDLLMDVPLADLPGPTRVLPRTRPAAAGEAALMAQLEFGLRGLWRERDFEAFLENRLGCWHCHVSLDEAGEVDGFLVTVDHPATRMLGPGAARDPESMEALLRAQLAHFRGRRVIFLLPAGERQLIRTVHTWGARNCELHWTQILGGAATPGDGILMPTFLPETA